jgi:hypothetical protein
MVPALGCYTLDDRGEPVPCDDLHEWGRWMQTADRQLAEDVVGDVRVSTVFLGLDHAFTGDVPVLWETLTFSLAETERRQELRRRGGGLRAIIGDAREPAAPFDQSVQRRYTSRADALAGHQEVVALVMQVAGSHER